MRLDLKGAVPFSTMSMAFGRSIIIHFNYLPLICVTKTVTKPGEFEGISGYFRAYWGHENTMMSIVYRLALLSSNP